MALLFVDSFDHYDTANISAKWPVNGSAQTINSTQGRRGGGAIIFGATSNSFVQRTIPAKSTLVFGAAIYPTAFNGARCIFALYSGSAFVLGLFLTITGQLTVSRSVNGGSPIIPAAGALPVNSWSYVEWKVTLSPTTSGASEARINGVTIHNEPAIATTASATSATVFGIAADTSSNSFYRADDFYLCDTLGSTANDFLGDVEVRATVPDSDGFYTGQYARSSGSDDFSLVDEVPPNTTDYLESDANGEKAALNMAALSGISGIVGIQVNNYTLKTDPGTALARNLVRSNGVDENGPDYGLSVSPLYGCSVHETNPDGSIPWTLAAVNAVQIGQENRS